MFFNLTVVSYIIKQHFFQEVVSVKPTCSTPQTTTGVLLYVRLILVVMLIVLSAAVLIYSRKSASKPRGEAAGNTHITKTTEHLKPTISH